MSFQGDVAGIGLGELLQGLARGGRDGVLTLYGPHLTASIGLKGGQLFLLSGPDERPEQWRERASRAWAEAPSPQVETRRREAIARAARLQTLYLMLDAANLTFRFEQGALPTSPSAHAESLRLHEQETSPEKSWGPGTTVEYLLLEHARIADESKMGPGSTLAGYDLPRALDPSRHDPSARDFLEQCDGRSTLQEIADRLGWPLLRCRVVVGDHLAASALRLAQPRELLAAAQRELELGRTGRAAARLTGWIQSAQPGPPSVGDADLLVGEWERGRLQHLFLQLEPRTGRALLRKLDRVHVDAISSRDRWRAMVEAHRSDDLSILHEASLRLVTTEDPDTSTFHDLLKLARGFHEAGLERRCRTLLRLTASHLPSRPQTRIELGKRMLQSGLIDDGQRWLLDTARELIDEGEGERAMIAIRAVLKIIPDHGEATGLLLQTRSLLAKRKRRRLHTMIALCTVLMIAVGAFVEFRSIQEMDRQLSEIKSQSARPHEALALLSQAFGNSDAAEVVELRNMLIRLRKEEDKRAFEAWREHYTAVEDECKFGDPIIGLRRALELVPPPDHRGPAADWDGRLEVLNSLARRLENRAIELDVGPEASLEDLNRELRLTILLDDLMAQIDIDTAPPAATAFRVRMSELKESILIRRQERAVVQDERASSELEKKQNILLATARAHNHAGDLKRSLDTYNLLLETDPSLESIFGEEIRLVRRHHEAVEEAVRLALEGRHAEAAKALEGDFCDRPVEHLLPWKVVTRPTGARVEVANQGIRTTPCTLYSGVGERVQLTFKLEGHRDRSIELTQPQDLVIDLFRFPERDWSNERRVEAAPIAVGDDHVLADRAGHVVRLNGDGRILWEQTLSTLGGIARTPVFLPQRPGHLLIMSEDGRAWLVQSRTGETEGPRDIGAPLVEGPMLTRSGVSARFADGRVAVWSTGLEPTFYDADGFAPLDVSGPTSAGGTAPDTGMVLLRRQIDAALSLRSPWTPWRVEVYEDHFRVVNEENRGFAVERQGDWIYVAWEAPKALLSEGRLWISDERGVHSYLPGGELVSYGQD